MFPLFFVVQNRYREKFFLKGNFFFCFSWVKKRGVAFFPFRYSPAAQKMISDLFNDMCLFMSPCFHEKIAFPNHYDDNIILEIEGVVKTAKNYTKCYLEKKMIWYFFVSLMCMVQFLTIFTCVAFFLVWSDISLYLLVLIDFSFSVLFVNNLNWPDRGYAADVFVGDRNFLSLLMPQVTALMNLMPVIHEQDALERANEIKDKIISFTTRGMEDLP